MSLFVVLNILFVISPILCYLIYMVYENIIGEKGNKMFFDLAIASSIYLITKYSLYLDYNADVLKVLLLVCMLRNRKVLSIIVYLYIVLYFGLLTDTNIYLLFIGYLIQLVVFFRVLKTKNNISKILVFAFISITIGVISNTNHLYIVISNVCYSLFAFLIYRCVLKAERLVNMYGALRQIEDDISFRETLFKVTHEIKNPIAVCKGYLDMMDVNNSKQTNKYVSIIKQEIERTLSLMNDFLNLTKLKVEKKDVDITLLLDDLSVSIEELLKLKDIKYVYESIDDDLYVIGDYDRLKQVFINILKNSMESIIEDGLIELKIGVKRNNVIITISDNGIGMNKETLKKVGEAFFTTKSNGTGLGVRLSKEIITMHEGCIKYTSKEGVGTTVKITLPIKKQVL